MSEYMKKEEFFEMEIDKLILECKDYELKRISSKAMILKTKDFEALQYVNTIV